MQSSWWMSLKLLVRRKLWVWVLVLVLLVLLLLRRWLLWLLMLLKTRLVVLVVRWWIRAKVQIGALWPIIVVRHAFGDLFRWPGKTKQ